MIQRTSDEKKAKYRAIDGESDWGGSKVSLTVKGRALGWAAVPSSVEVDLG